MEEILIFSQDTKVMVFFIFIGLILMMFIVVRTVNSEKGERPCVFLESFAYAAIAFGMSWMLTFGLTGKSMFSPDHEWKGTSVYSMVEHHARTEGYQKVGWEENLSTVDFIAYGRQGRDLLVRYDRDGVLFSICTRENRDSFFGASTSECRTEVNPLDIDSWMDSLRTSFLKEGGQ